MTRKTERSSRRKADFAFVLEPSAHAPGEARRELDARLPQALPQALVEDMMLLTTELVTNSVRYAPADAAGGIEVCVSFLPAAVRCEVRDPGDGFAAVPQQPSTFSEGGRGLFLVDAIASRWGKGQRENTSVWYELDVEGDDEAPAASREVTAPARSESDVTEGAIELAAELRALANATESVDRQSRSIEAELSRVTDVLKRGAERLSTRRKLAPEGEDASA